MKILAIGDPHFKVSGVTEHTEMTASVIVAARREAPDLIVVLGDILDRHETIHVSPLTRAVAFLTELSTIAKTYVLVGNHDLKNNRQFLSKEHSLVALKEHPSMVIVDEPIREGDFVFCPYLPTGRFREGLDQISWQSAKAIFAHQEFVGAQMESLVSTEGDPWPIGYPLVISGHIHGFQQPQGNLIYVGSPMQINFGDSPDKGLSLFTFGATTDHKRIPLGLRKKIVVSLHGSQIESYEPPPQHIVKIQLQVSRGMSRALQKHPQVKKWTSEGHVVQYQIIDDAPKATVPSLRNSFSRTVEIAVAEDEQLLEIFRRLLSTS